jgi:cytochrome c553
MKVLAVTTLALVVISLPAFAAKGDAAKGQSIASGVCAACHGADGNSMITANPALAGQHPEYLFKQLKNYKSGERKNPIMSVQVANLSEDDMLNLAAYFASQKPKGGVARNAGLVSAGQKLYRGGNSSTGIAACVGCHSPNGAGIPIQYPRLKGQQAEYTVAQLKAFRAGERANDPNMMMRGVAARMSDKEMEALAEYISGLK